MGICYLFAAGPVKDYQVFPKIQSQSEDLILCADGGLIHAKALGLAPDILIGDLDSCRERPEGIQIFSYPPEKDDTDFILALKLGLKKGYREFYIFGALGGRLDHTLANLQGLLYLKRHGANGILFGEKDEVHLLVNETFYFSRRQGPVTLLSFSDTCEGVTTKGLAYPLKNAVLSQDFPLGISNEFSEEEASVSVEKGALLVIFSKD